MRPLLIIVLIFNSIVGQCCINEYHTLLNGKLRFVDESPFTAFPKYDLSDTAYLKRELYYADTTYKYSGRIEDFSDYGVLLIYNHRLNESLDVFQTIEKIHPNLYATAANLGTTYELLGKDDSALIWLGKAININPSSHDSSEWIHINILKAKIASGGDQNYFYNHSILGLNFGSGAIPDTNLNVDLLIIKKELMYQLSERMTFIRPKDILVGQLLFELGNICAITDDLESATGNYELSRMYGFSNTVMILREQYFSKLSKKASAINSHNNPDYYIELQSLYIIIGMTISVLTLLFLFIRHKSKEDAAI